MAPTTEHIEAMKDKAVAALARQDNITVSPDDIEFVKFEGELKDIGEGKTYLNTNTAGQYLIVRRDGEVIAVYKVQVKPGPARGQRTPEGHVVYVVTSLSIGLKRIKRAPKGLLP